MTRLILLRHGQTEWNVEGRYQGQLDSALTPLGYTQARALAARAARLRFAALYSSDLGRARATAELCAQATGLNVILDSRLRERHLGRWQGQLRAELRAQFPAEYRRFKDDPDHEIPGGESARQFSTRVMACLDEIVTRHDGQEFALVTHGGVTSALLRFALGLPLHAPRRFEHLNASWNVFLFDHGRWLLETWGDVSHLTAPDPARL